MRWECFSIWVYCKLYEYSKVGLWTSLLRMLELHRSGCSVLFIAPAWPWEKQCFLLTFQLALLSYSLSHSVYLWGYLFCFQCQRFSGAQSQLNLTLPEVEAMLIDMAALGKKPAVGPVANTGTYDGERNLKAGVWQVSLFLNWGFMIMSYSLLHILHSLN